MTFCEIVIPIRIWKGCNMRNNLEGYSSARHTKSQIPLRYIAGSKLHGSKLVANRFEAGRRTASNLFATNLEPATNQLA